ncbi:hypothetical protein GCM10009836_72810 [Pseudonocardia ailaonensis]|uniref:DUF1269 domain-containing family protein n=1 Tax=Pseudonocardia ailaonensis TaxID=367279 RepID=A0ABN2NQN9_9PSEU
MSGPTIRGPVEWVALDFPGENVDPTVVPAIARLVDSGTVRILDLLLVRRPEHGGVEIAEYDELDLPIRAALDGVDGEVLGLLSEEDLPVITEELTPGSTALVVVWESLWASELAAVVREAGGRLLTHDRIRADALAVALRATQEGIAP